MVVALVAATAAPSFGFKLSSDITGLLRSKAPRKDVLERSVAVVVVAVAGGGVVVVV